MTNLVCYVMSRPAQGLPKHRQYTTMIASEQPSSSSPPSAYKHTFPSAIPIQLLQYSDLKRTGEDPMSVSLSSPNFTTSNGGIDVLLRSGPKQCIHIDDVASKYDSTKC